MADQLKPRRRVHLQLDLQANDWNELRMAWQQIEFRLFAEQTEEGNVSVVSGGCGSGHILTVNVDPTKNEQTYRADLRDYLDRPVTP